MYDITWCYFSLHIRLVNTISNITDIIINQYDNIDSTPWWMLKHGSWMMNLHLHLLSVYCINDDGSMNLRGDEDESSSSLPVPVIQMVNLSGNL